MGENTVNLNPSLRVGPTKSSVCQARKGRSLLFIAPDGSWEPGESLVSQSLTSFWRRPFGLPFSTRCLASFSLPYVDYCLCLCAALQSRRG